MSHPLVSVIIPAYNVAPWIKTTLFSVCSQTFTDFECIVINDGSSDETLTRIQEVVDCRIRIATQENFGVSSARNYGLRLSKGKYIAFLDGDDVWLPKALELMVAPLLDDLQHIDLVWADFVRFKDCTCEYLPLPSTRVWHTENTWEDMLVDNFMQFGALCVRANIAKKFLFDMDLKIGEDRDWLLRVLKGRLAKHVPQTVLYYRQRPGSAIRNIHQFLVDEETTLKNHLKSDDISPKIRRNAMSSFYFHRAVLLSKLPNNRIKSLQSLLKAIAVSPLYCETYLRVFKKIFLTLLPKKKVTLPK